MQLHYLLFDFSDEESGRGSFDAMATVVPERLAALLAEVSAVLRWAHEQFGCESAAGDEGEWGYDLQALAEPDTALDVEIAQGRVLLSPVPRSATTMVTLTLGGSPSFCDAFRQTFDIGD